MSHIPYSRRFRRRLTAIQSRLDAGAADRWIPYGIGSLLALVLGLTSTARFDGLDMGPDLAGYTQAIWLLTEGISPTATLLGEGVHLLELRWSFFLYVLTVPGWFFPIAKTLLVAQAVALGLAVVPLWLLCRKVARLRVGAATAICLAYALHPATQRIGAVDFHPEAFALPALLALVYYGATRRWLLYWPTLFLVLLIQADLGLVIAVFALFVLGDAERSTGLWTLAIGLVWSLGLLLVAQPLSGETGVIGGVYGEYGDSFGDALIEIVSNPGRFAGDLTERENITLLLGLLTPVLFLPMLSLRHLIPALPAVALLVLTQSTDSSQGIAPVLAFVMVSSVFALDRLGTLGVDRVFLDPRLLTALIAVASLLYLTRSPLSPYDEPWRFADRDESDEELVAAAIRLEASVPVRASANILPHLADRPFAYSLSADQPTVAAVVFRSRAVLIDQRTLDEPLGPDQLDSFTAQMAGLGFNLVNDDPDGEILLFFRP